MEISGLQSQGILADKPQENRLDHIRTDGFQQHVVHAGCQAFVEITLEGMGDDTDDGNSLVASEIAHALGDLETIDITERRIEKDDGWRLFDKKAQGLLARGGEPPG